VKKIILILLVFAPKNIYLLEYSPYIEMKNISFNIRQLTAKNTKHDSIHY